MFDIIAQMFQFFKPAQRPPVQTRPRYWCKIRNIGDLCQLSLERGALAI